MAPHRPMSDQRTAAILRTSASVPSRATSHAHRPDPPADAGRFSRDQYHAWRQPGAARQLPFLRSGHNYAHLSRRPSYWMDCPEASGQPARLADGSYHQPISGAALTCWPAGCTWRLG